MGGHGAVVLGWAEMVVQCFDGAEGRKRARWMEQFINKLFVGQPLGGSRGGGSRDEGRG